MCHLITMDSSIVSKFEMKQDNTNVSLENSTTENPKPTIDIQPFPELTERQHFDFALAEINELVETLAWKRDYERRGIDFFKDKLKNQIGQIIDVNADITSTTNLLVQLQKEPESPSKRIQVVENKIARLQKRRNRLLAQHESNSLAESMILTYFEYV